MPAFFQVTVPVLVTALGAPPWLKSLHLFTTCPSVVGSEVLLVNVASARIHNFTLASTLPGPCVLMAMRSLNSEVPQLLAGIRKVAVQKPAPVAPGPELYVTVRVLEPLFNPV